VVELGAVSMIVVRFLRVLVVLIVVVVVVVVVVGVGQGRHCTITKEYCVGRLSVVVVLISNVITSSSMIAYPGTLVAGRVCLLI
jgi:hypothetical protein